MPRALLSVFDKTGLVDFASTLVSLGWELVSTGGTARTLRAAQVAVTDVESLTHFPEMLDGRVKTLHPAVHGGLLARRSDPAHMAAIAEHGIDPIDLVCVNLYPFREAAAKKGLAFNDVIEQIDIGGPAMLRSAAKNHESVYAVVEPADYPKVIAALRSGDDDLDLRRLLAEKVFAHCAAYDATIAAWFALQRDERFPERVTVSARRAQTLRYGENPGQRAALYLEEGAPGFSGLRQRGGKELSFNNLLDVEGALQAVDPFSHETCCAIIKHTTPCGLATGASSLEAYQKALACDPASAFGSVIAFTVPVDVATAEALSALFVECVVAPSFSDEAIDILGRKKNLRVLEGTAPRRAHDVDVKRIRGGFLVQEHLTSIGDDSTWQLVTKRAPTDEQRTDLLFAWRAVASVKSNAIVLASRGATIGIGAGQMSRVDAAYLAIHKARNAGHPLEGAVLGSDAFFPFPDSVEQAADAGIKAVVQPGGSVRDAEVIAAADARDIAMVVTGQRLFRH